MNKFIALRVVALSPLFSGADHRRKHEICTWVNMFNAHDAAWVVAPDSSRPCPVQKTRFEGAPKGLTQPNPPLRAPNARVVQHASTRCFLTCSESRQVTAVLRHSAGRKHLPLLSSSSLPPPPPTSTPHFVRFVFLLPPSTALSVFPTVAR